ncbi:MAG TPA: hypothetical protein VFB15_04805 [Candidatus Binataceae bacterium]|nr:hypothetical protein [Candidatus Binataceae bacterium]
MRSVPAAPKIELRSFDGVARSESRATDPTLTCQARNAVAANDAFSFWKLAEEWQPALNEIILESARIAEHYLFENYLAACRRRPPSGLDTYYLVKNLIPDKIRFSINSLAIRVRRRQTFPNWPCEGTLLRLWRQWLQRALRQVGATDGWHIGFWPRGFRSCIVITHDVESSLGLDAMNAVADLEERYGFRSAWNLPLQQYAIDWKQVDNLRERGFEFGAHGLRHDGKLFRSAADFAALKPKLEKLAREHGLHGFRAPSTLRRAEWIASMTFDFDSSFADTDPWEPQPGGTCSIFPFFLSSQMVELPYTLPQDHTLIHLLHRDPLQVWMLKADWIASVGGLILTLTHPDYSGSGRYLQKYEDLLKHLAAIEGAWRALPSEVARWWRNRAALTLRVGDSGIRIEGAQAGEAVAVALSKEPLAN